MNEPEKKQLGKLQDVVEEFRRDFSHWTGKMDERFRDYPQVKKQVEINASDIQQIKTVWLTIYGLLLVVSIALSIFDKF